MIKVIVENLKTMETFVIQGWKLDLSHYMRAELIKKDLSVVRLEYSDYEIVEVIGL